VIELLPGLGGASLVAAAVVVVVGYGVMGLTGFGATIFAVPMLALMLPLKLVVPMMLFFDILGTASIALGSRRHVAWRELARLVPFMLLGQAVGLSLLVQAPAAPLLVALGVFVLANAAWSLRAPPTRQVIAAGWAVPVGCVGGVFSALFGTGGPVYATFFTRRIAEPGAVRATSAMLILLSASIRGVLYASAGLYQQDGLLATVALLLPCSALGVWAGSRLHRALPPHRARRVLLVVLALGGVAVIAKGLAS
jgi:uncharacterized protein